VTPRATYRLQFHKDFGFDAAAQLAPYLQSLGISHVYASPYLKARAGSTHGYDIVDHAQLNPELGDAATFARMVRALKTHRLGQILDFVPNHMGVGDADNPLWLDVLEWGPEGPHAGWFDIEWEPERRYLLEKILVPFLGDQYGIELEAGKLRLEFDDNEGTFAVWAYGRHKLPIKPTHYARVLGDAHPELERLGDAFTWLPLSRPQMMHRAAELKTELAVLVRERPDAREALYLALNRFTGEPGDANSWRELDVLIQDQYWRVAHFRVAADDINYRRFFNINDLAGLRIELPDDVDHAHHRVLQLVEEGVLDGMRIDHVDGLLDPLDYLRRLRKQLEAHGGAPSFYLVVEKILAPHEWLREDWPVDGTTGYDFANQVLGLLIDASAETAFTDLYADFIGRRMAFAPLVRECKLQIMDNEMASELNVLARDTARLARQNPRTADFTYLLLRRALKELIACFPVYRTYMDTSGAVDAADQRDVSWALAQARRHEEQIDPSVFDFLQALLNGSLIATPRSGFSRQAVLRCVMRTQQYSGPVMAKGLEDTAFYRYNRFIALNEVGGSPERFGIQPTVFHRANMQRAQRWPHAMISTATHDTKRGEDTRARLAALAELPEEWGRQLAVWSRILRGPLSDTSEPLQPDRNDEYLFYQILLGSWPPELLDVGNFDGEALRPYCERVKRTMTKSMREARVHSSWASPNGPYEEATLAFVDTALNSSRSSTFVSAFLPFVSKVAALGAHNSLIQTVLKLTCPGVPDIYQGTELWDFSMVDPDNRRAIDYALRARSLREVDAALIQDRRGAMGTWFRDWQDGRFKLATVATLLRCRREHVDLFANSDYQPLALHGARTEELCAFARQFKQQALLVLIARLPQRRAAGGIDEDVSVSVPEALQSRSWRELLSGRELPAADSLAVTTLLADLPAAVLLTSG
jgi:(1->4)-alpha-D-glucan 1-alpha-D-glucosylmutase